MSSAEELTVQSNKVTNPYKNQVVQGLALVINAGIQAIPFVGSPIATLIFGGMALKQERRAQVFLDELENRLETVEEEALTSEEFTHAFTAATRTALNTRQDEKIRLFARLFANYAKGDMEETSDAFDEYLSILDDLSIREFQTLLILDKYERTAPIDLPSHLRRTENINGLFWIPFIDEIEATMGISLDEIPSLLERLRRTGLYQTWPNSQSGEFEYKGLRMDFDIGRLTLLFDRFIRFLEIDVCSSPAEANEERTDSSRSQIDADDKSVYQQAKEQKNVYFRLSHELSEDEARAVIKRTDMPFTLITWVQRSPDMHVGSPQDCYRYTVNPSVAHSTASIWEYLRTIPEIEYITETPSDLYR